MSELIKLSCDQCGGDLTPLETPWPRLDIITLECLNAAISGGFTYALATHVPFSKKHFCNLDCLAGWVGENKEKIHAHWRVGIEDKWPHNISDTETPTTPTTGGES